MNKWFTDNLILKIIALGLAIITWVYIQEILRHY